MLFDSKLQNFPYFAEYCKLNPFKKPRLLSNPYLLPCGYPACLECIYKQYNLFKKTLRCEICNQEHRLPKDLEPFKTSLISNFLNENLIYTLINQNKTFVLDIGIFVNLISLNFCYL